MAAVSNSSPLILFSKAGRLDLLRAVFGRLVIPQAVFQEVTTEGAGRPGAAETGNAAWIEVRPLSDRSLAEKLMAELDRGEAEAIALAVELGLEFVLIDDGAGRRGARELGLRVIGSAGTLVLAKDRGVLPVVGPVIEELRAAGLYLGRAARSAILAAAGELPPAENRDEAGAEGSSTK